MIAIKNLSIILDGEKIIRNFSAVFPENQVSVLIGRNGCGKTTLLRAIAGLNKAESGTILWKNDDLSAVSVKEHAKIVAFLPQSREVPSVSVRSLVSHGRFPYLEFPRKLRKVDREIISNAMEMAGVSQFAERNLATLSGGQRQKVYIAMVLCQDTPVVLLDEPATYLDISQQLEVLQMAKKIAAMGKTVIMVHHDIPQAVKYGDNVVLMDEGELVYQGSGMEMVKKGLVDRIFGVKTKIIEDNLIIE